MTREHPQYDLLFKKLKDTLGVNGRMDELQILECAIARIKALYDTQADTLEDLKNEANRVLPDAIVHEPAQAGWAMSAEIYRLRDEVAKLKDGVK